MGGLMPPRPLQETDNRQSFDCGRESLNIWFRRNAWRNQAGNTSRTSVIVNPQTRGIAAYASLSAAHIQRELLPKSDQRNRPANIPMLLLGQLAVDIGNRGRGHAAALLLHVFETSIRFSRDIGCFGILTHPLDEDVRAFYARFGFEDAPFDPDRSMIMRIVDLIHSGIGDA
jgi:predicted GNAT family N-acyltransferase